MKPPAHVYRYLPEAQFADDFVRGKVRLSTLVTCRNAEDARGDPGEAIDTSHADYVAGHTCDPSFRSILSRTPFSEVRGEGHVSFEGLSFAREISDAFVLCLTTTPSPALAERFGPYCVRIDDLKGLFTALSHALRRSIGPIKGYCGMVEYAPRERDIRQEALAPIGFLKPVKFDDEAECRLLWLPVPPAPLDPRFLSVPEIQGYCARIA